MRKVFNKLHQWAQAAGVIAIAMIPFAAPLIADWAARRRDRKRRRK